MSKSRHSDRPKKVRYYHASPRRFRHGDVLTGGHEGGYAAAARRESESWFESRPTPDVCMTDSPAPHATILRHAVEDDWFVYEVEPIGSVSYKQYDQEFRAHAVRVLRLVGRSRGLAAKWRSGTFRSAEGSYSSFPRPEPRRGVKLYDRRDVLGRFRG